MAIVDADVAARFGWTVIRPRRRVPRAAAPHCCSCEPRTASSGWLLDTASAIVTLAHQANALVIVNDRADIARLSGADGVHVGQEDLAPALVRRIVGTTAIVGLSTHTPEQLDAAIAEPVTMSRSVLSSAPPRRRPATTPRSRAVRRAAERAAARAKPLVAIGGVTLETAPEVLRAGATTVAVISDLVAGGDPAARVRAYLARLTV